jgi:hypothetical protein
LTVWKLSITTPSNLYADGIILRLNRSTHIETDQTLSGAPKGRYVTLRSEDVRTLTWLVSNLQRDIEMGRITRIELKKESG